MHGPNHSLRMVANSSSQKFNALVARWHRQPATGSIDDMGSRLCYRVGESPLWFCPGVNATAISH